MNFMVVVIENLGKGIFASEFWTGRERETGLGVLLTIYENLEVGHQGWSSLLQIRRHLGKVSFMHSKPGEVSLLTLYLDVEVRISR